MLLGAWAGRLSALAFAGVLAACAYTGGVGDPVARKLSWFSYAAGDDIRARCTADAPAQYRFVYNANWNEQVRVYDVKRSVISGGGAMLFADVFGGYGGVLNNFSFNDPQAPWRGPNSQVHLTEDQYLALIRAVEASGFGAASPEGLRLDSWDFYWVATACAAGRFHLYAWKYPSPEAAAISFDKLLFAADTTGVRVNPVRPIDRAEQYILSTGQNAKYYGESFQLMVGRDDLVGRSRL